MRLTHYVTGKGKSMKLIDADELKKKKKHSTEFAENIVSVSEIDWQPTVDAIPVEWINHYMDTNLTKVSLFYSCMSEFVRDWQKEQEDNNGD